MVIGCFQMLQVAEEIRTFCRGSPDLFAATKKRRGCPRRLDLIASVRRY
jgi:hypothetical protein